MVLHRCGLNVKQGPQWVPGIWLGKTEQEDLHVVATCDGIIKGKAILHTSTAWRPIWLFLVKDKPYQSTRKRVPRTLRFGGTVTPKPVTHVQPEGQDEETIDYDARDVRDYAERHPHDTDDEGDRLQEEQDRKREAEDESFSPRKTVKLQDGGDQGGPATGVASGLADSAVLDDTAVQEPQSKAPRLSPGAQNQVPQAKGFSHRALQAVFLQVEEVVGEVDDDSWENSILDFCLVMKSFRMMSAIS